MSGYSYNFQLLFFLLVIKYLILTGWMSIHFESKHGSFVVRADAQNLLLFHSTRFTAHLEKGKSTVHVSEMAVQEQ